jgi:hypothetical protein
MTDLGNEHPAIELRTTYGRLIMAWAGVRATRLALRTVGFRRTIRLLASAPRIFSAVVAPNPLWMAEIGEASKGRYGATCLDRSVALWFVLRQHSLEGTVRIGVARGGDTFDAHAWVEYRGAVLNDSPDVADRFAVFDEDPVDLVFR